MCVLKLILVTSTLVLMGQTATLLYPQRVVFQDYDDALPSQIKPIQHQNINNNKIDQEAITIKQTCQHYGDQKLEIVDRIFELGVHFSKFIDRNSTSVNFVISPLNLGAMICQLIFSTRGESQKNLLHLLYGGQYNDLDQAHLSVHRQVLSLFCELKKIDDSSDVMSINYAGALFVQPEIQIFKSYRANLTGEHGTPILQTDFKNDPYGAVKQINNWANQQSNGRISEILSSPLPPGSFGFLANSLYFKDDWKLPFSDELTAMDKFEVKANQFVETSFMRAYNDLLFTKSDKYQCSMIALPYQGEKNTMYIILPHQNNPVKFDIKNFAKHFYSNNIIEEIKSGFKIRQVRVMLPKIKVTNKLSLVSAFQGKTSKRFNFNGVSPSGNFYVDDLVQQVSITINEKGTEAAAITSSTIMLSGGAESFFVNRPFMFFINNELTGVTMFWGTISNPLSY